MKCYTKLLVLIAVIAILDARKLGRKREGVAKGMISEICYESSKSNEENCENIYISAKEIQVNNLTTLEEAEKRRSGTKKV